MKYSETCSVNPKLFQFVINTTQYIYIYICLIVVEAPGSLFIRFGWNAFQMGGGHGDVLFHPDFLRGQGCYPVLF